MRARRRLPRWAMRANPHVRRNLSRAALRESLDLSRLWRVFLLSSGIIGATLVLEPLAMLVTGNLSMLLFASPLLVMGYAWLLGAIFALPLLVVLYGVSLIRVGRQAAALIMREREEDRLTLLRTVPDPLPNIFLSQIAACIWNDLAQLNTLLWIAAALALPPILLTHTTLWFADTPRPIPQITMLASLITALARPWLELVMVGALGTLVGAFARYRISASISVSLLAAAYFILSNMPRLLPLSPWLRLLVEVALPLALPPLITLLTLTVAERTLTAD